MRNVVLLFVFLCMGIAVLNAVQIRSAGSGNWYDPATWENGTIPGPYDDVLIRSSHYVNLEGSFQLQSQLGLIFEGIRGSDIFCSSSLFFELSRGHRDPVNQRMFLSKVVFTI